MKGRVGKSRRVPKLSQTVKLLVFRRHTNTLLCNNKMQCATRYCISNWKQSERERRRGTDRECQPGKPTLCEWVHAYRSSGEKKQHKLQNLHKFNVVEDKTVHTKASGGFVVFSPSRSLRHHSVISVFELRGNLILFFMALNLQKIVGVCAMLVWTYSDMNFAH